MGIRTLTVLPNTRVWLGCATLQISFGVVTVRIVTLYSCPSIGADSAVLKVYTEVHLKYNTGYFTAEGYQA